jgi:4'-phosphopantetheinyl transferase
LASTEPLYGLPEETLALPDAIKWISSPKCPVLGMGDIHVWLINLVIGAINQEKLKSFLSADEKLRTDRFHFDHDRIRYVAARGAMRAILSTYVGVPSDQLEFRYGKQGKPNFEPDSAGKFLSFNLSHSGDLAIMAVGRNRNIGIDVERIRTDCSYEEIALAYFSADEFKFLTSLRPENRAKGFFDCWTRKEAYIKARGGGLQIPRENFDVSLELDAPGCFRRDVDSRWHMFAFLAVRGYPAALVYDGRLADIRYFSSDRLVGGEEV